MDLIRQLQFVADGKAIVEDGWAAPTTLQSLEADGFILFEPVELPFERGKYRRGHRATLTSKGLRFLEAEQSTLRVIESALTELGYKKA